MRVTMTESYSQNYVLGSEYLTFLLAILIRWCISIHSYSGTKTPPMFGDYEAQRHWMEITYNLPIQDWYREVEDNNLTYWGLDYPPLTAYHSYLYGFLASQLVPSSVELHKSRGHEGYSHKLFMRYSVLAVDLLIYVPAVCLYFRTSRRTEESLAPKLGIFLTLLYPGLMLIDYGHFQYNCVSLGLFIASVALLTNRYFKLSSLLFCLAVNYKQMELYHALPFFVYFLGNFFSLFFRRRNPLIGITFIVPIALVVVCTFIGVWFPFLSSVNDVTQVISRVFPISRGVYEDKVASFWCMLNVVYKMQQSVDNQLMVRICLIVTIISVLPSLFDLLFTPSVEKFKLSLIICSLCFFLFSFHVHEKSILLVAIPVSLNISCQPIITIWFLLVSTFSMLPLLIKDGLFLPFLVLFCFYYLCCRCCLRSVYDRLFLGSNKFKNLVPVVVDISLVSCIVLSLISRFCTPPDRYPFLWPLLVSFYSFVHFAAFLMYYYCQQFASLFKKKKS